MGLVGKLKQLRSEGMPVFPQFDDSGYKLAEGAETLTSATANIATGLTSIKDGTVHLTLKATSAPSVAMLTYGIDGGTLDVYAWIASATGDTIMIASDSTASGAIVGWEVKGLP